MSRSLFFTLAILIMLQITACSEDVETIKSAPKTTFFLLDGRSVTLDAFDSEWILVNFWSVSCPPCYEEMPDLVKLNSEDGITVIGVSMPYDRPDLVLETQHKMKLSYPLSLDLTGQINRDFGNIKVIPSSFLIDPEGSIVKTYLGTVTHRKLLVDVDQFKQQVTD